MATDKSGIEWTDATWNPVTGCSKVSPGCAHCYAETVALRFWKDQYAPTVLMTTVDQSDGTSRDQYAGQRPRAFTDVRTHEDRLDQPLRWKKPRRIFVNSMSDLFHEDVPEAFIDKVFAVMWFGHWHTFQVLTKRADRMLAYATSPNRAERVYQAAQGLLASLPSNTQKWIFLREGAWAALVTDRPVEHALWPLPNVWLGVSVENQRFADERITLLLQTPAAVRFISAEPLLGPIDFESLDCFPQFDHRPTYDYYRTFLKSQGVESDGKPVKLRDGLDWVIVGGESGKGARPFDLAWARSIVQQCHDAGVKVFVKQLGARPTCDGCGDPAAVFPLRDKKGGDITEFPPDLRVREFPLGAADVS